MRIVLGIVTVVACLSSVGCRSQRQQPPLVVPRGEASADAVFEAALARAREHGYPSVKVDARHKTATFIARYGNFEREGLAIDGLLLHEDTNYFRLKVLGGGLISISAAGADVHGHRIDRTLQWELEVFAARVAGRDPAFP